MKVTKHWLALEYAGTTMSTPAGFENAIPFEPGATQVSVDVWAPSSGIAVRLKAEEYMDMSQFVETQQNVALGGEWQTMIFDFFQNVPGSPSINYDVDYTVLSIFFDFGNPGYLSGTQTFYYDNVVFGEGSNNVSESTKGSFSVRPNLIANGGDTFISFEGNAAELVVYDLKGVEVMRRTMNSSGWVSMTGLPSGMYAAVIRTSEGHQFQERLSVVD
jgi:hypothetical protein